MPDRPGNKGKSMPKTLPEPGYFKTPDGLSHAYYELGSVGSGPAIILQHGFSASTWHEWVQPGIAEAVASLGRRVIGLDARGHGQSTRSHDSAHYGEVRMAEDVSALIDFLGIEQFDYLGYSMGGVIGLRLAVIETRLRRLVVGGIGEGAVICGGVDKRALDPAELAECLRAESGSGFSAMAQAFRSGVIALGNDRLALAAHADAIVRTPIPFERITMTTLVIAGDADPLALAPERLVAALPDGRLHLVPGDHGSARLSAEFTETVLAFLR
jgi:pimeloyl-ACP methyl ester carboxylesterase